MSVGGIVHEVIDCGPKEGIWVDTVNERGYDHCAIYIEYNEMSKQIIPGDKLWWQSGRVYWNTDRILKDAEGFDYTLTREAKLRKISGSGVSRPVPLRPDTEIVDDN